MSVTSASGARRRTSAATTGELTTTWRCALSAARSARTNSTSSRSSGRHGADDRPVEAGEVVEVQHRRHAWRRAACRCDLVEVQDVRLDGGGTHPVRERAAGEAPDRPRERLEPRAERPLLRRELDDREREVGRRIPGGRPRGPCGERRHRDAVLLEPAQEPDRAAARGRTLPERRGRQGDEGTERGHRDAFSPLRRSSA